MIFQKIFLKIFLGHECLFWLLSLIDTPLRYREKSISLAGLYILRLRWEKKAFRNPDLKFESIQGFGAWQMVWVIIYHNNRKWKLKIISTSNMHLNEPYTRKCSGDTITPRVILVNFKFEILIKNLKFYIYKLVILYTYTCVILVNFLLELRAAEDWQSSPLPSLNWGGPISFFGRETVLDDTIIFRLIASLVGWFSYWLAPSADGLCRVLTETGLDRDVDPSSADPFFRRLVFDGLCLVLYYYAPKNDKKWVFPSPAWSTWGWFRLRLLRRLIGEVRHLPSNHSRSWTMW